MHPSDSAPPNQTGRQTELFQAAGFLPQSIAVGPFGLNEDWLRSVLSLPATQLHSWHGDELGAPRDYVYRGHRFYYTAEGVRRILSLLKLENIVEVIVRQPPPPPPQPVSPNHSARKGAR
jgi:hypothetical protein